MEKIKYQPPHQCPICTGELTINSLSCGVCGSRMEGKFSLCKFCRLPAEQREFIEVFIKCRGSIKEVEKELGISYPTVRSRLDSVIEALGHPVVSKVGKDKADNGVRELLDAIEQGEITASEGISLLKHEGFQGEKGVSGDEGKE